MFPNSEDFFSSSTLLHATVTSIKVWMRTTRSRPCHGQPNLQTWPLKNLWNVIKRKIGVHKSSNRAELLEFLCQEWHKVTQQHCEGLVESMPRHMKAVIKNLSYSIKYRFPNSSVKTLLLWCFKNKYKLVFFAFFEVWNTAYFLFFWPFVIFCKEMLKIAIFYSGFLRNVVNSLKHVCNVYFTQMHAFE